MGALRFIIALAFVVLLVTFGIHNMDPVTVRFYGVPSRSYPLFFLLLGAFSLGALVIWLFSVSEKFRLQWRLRREQSQLRSLQGRVREMEERSLVPVPVEDEDVQEPRPRGNLPAEVPPAVP